MTEPKPVDHYENFPVASWLCPPPLRPPIAAIYWFARTADDIADEGDLPAEQRIADLAAYRADLLALSRGDPFSPRWQAVFAPLGVALHDFALPVPLLLDLLSAFEQDIVKSRDHAGYRDRIELLDYCARSANPVGRLLLHLHGIDDATSLARSDAICSSLQLINFWQDISQDHARGRRYLPDSDCAAFGLDAENAGAAPVDRRRALVRHECDWAREMMLEGAPLAKRVPGRAGWELRGVVQGGLRVLDRIAGLGYDTFTARPKLNRWDIAVIAARMAWM